jgi:hypothetical protein
MTASALIYGLILVARALLVLGTILETKVTWRDVSGITWLVIV